MSPYRVSSEAETAFSGTMQSRNVTMPSRLWGTESLLNLKKPDETPKELMEFDKLLEESLSSDEETLSRIEPRNKRKYALCNPADDIKSLKKYGLSKATFKYDEDQEFD